MNTIFFNVIIQNKSKMNYNFKTSAINKAEAIGKALQCYNHLYLKIIDVKQIQKDYL